MSRNKIILSILTIVAVVGVSVHTIRIHSVSYLKSEIDLFYQDVLSSNSIKSAGKMERYYLELYERAGNIDKKALRLPHEKQAVIRDYLYVLMDKLDKQEFDNEFLNSSGSPLIGLFYNFSITGYE